MTYLALDPGTSTGWARFNVQGVMTDFGTCKSLDELIDLLDAMDPPMVVIYEDFTLFQGKAIQQSGSNMPASKAIGIIESAARRWDGVQVIKQRSNIKPIAERLSGVKPKGSHDKSHHVDAFNHGYYYLTKIGVLQSRAKPIR